MITSQTLYLRGSSYETLFVLSSSNKERLLYKSTGSSTSYIILLDLEANGVASPTIVLDFALVSDTDSKPFEAPPSHDYAPALDNDTKLLEEPSSPDYTSDYDSNTKPFKEDPQEADLEDSFEEDPLEEDSSVEDFIEDDEPLQAQVAPEPPTQPPPTFLAIVVQPGQEIPLSCPYRIYPNERSLICIPRKVTRAPFILLPSIEVNFADEIVATPYAYHNHYHHHHQYNHHHHLLCYHLARGFRTTSPQRDTTDETMTEAIIPGRLCKKSDARHWTFVVPTIRTWRDVEGLLSVFELGEISLAAHRIADAMTAYAANQNSRNEANHEASRSAGGVEYIVHNCSYKEFLTCKPQNFKGTKGAVGLTHWFEKIELVFHIRNCVENCKVKYAACTMMDGVLTWWNSYVKTIGLDSAYETTWKELKQMIIDEYCPRNEVQKMEVKLLNLSIKGTDIVGYTRCFQEQALLCPAFVTPKSEALNEQLESSKNMF
nr:reverse transcriptase domain-containing protein [Tanacetum cinerariifolium]